MVKVYPTVTTGTLQVIKNVTAEKLTYSIYGLNGNLFRSGALAMQEGKTEIDIQNLEAAIYILRIQSAGSSVAYKIVKQ